MQDVRIKCKFLRQSSLKQTYVLCVDLGDVINFLTANNKNIEISLFLKFYVKLQTYSLTELLHTDPYH